jgi:hypothetical protein
VEVIDTDQHIGFLSYGMAKYVRKGKFGDHSGVLKAGTLMHSCFNILALKTDAVW